MLVKTKHKQKQKHKKRKRKKKKNKEVLDESQNSRYVSLSFISLVCENHLYCHKWLNCTSTAHDTLSTKRIFLHGWKVQNLSRLNKKNPIFFVATDPVILKCISKLYKILMIYNINRFHITLVKRSAINMDLT